MTMLGVTESVQYFTWRDTAHMVLDTGTPGEWAVCGQRLSYLRDETELMEARHQERTVQKLCKRCIRKSEGIVRAPVLGPLKGPFNLEIAYRGEWVHFGSIANMDSNNIEWIDGYRKLCQEVLARFLEGQKS